MSRRTVKAMIRALLYSSAFAIVFPASAAVILSPQAVVSNSAGDFGAGFTIANTIDGSGLPAFTSGVTDFDDYLASNPLHSFNPGTEWFSPENGVRTSTIIYDLGGSYLITKMALWNEDAGGLTDVTVSGCSDSVCSSATTLLSLTALTDNADTANYPADVLDISDFTTSYVRLVVNGPQNAARWNGLAMGEVAFAFAAAVPEPGTLALLGLGLAGLAVGRRRKQ
ncbi:MAG TPA: PEP-CTERM sorting domain-containing protein [Burkholderiales bacterium]|nr:PEP-CTERM sorting domain-containing protein [Burkholderiales bacterium]